MRRYNHRTSERDLLRLWEQRPNAPRNKFYAVALVPEAQGLGLENARLLILADAYSRWAEGSRGSLGLGVWGNLSDKAREEARQLGCFVSELGENVPLLCVEARDFAHLSRELPRERTLVCGRLFQAGMTVSELLPDFGGDAVRLALLSLGPPGKDLKFKYEVLGAGFRFVQRLWRLAQAAMLVKAEFADVAEDVAELRSTVQQRMAGQKPHTALAAVMGYVNRLKTPNPAAMRDVAQLVEPFAPFIAGNLLHHLPVPALQHNQGRDDHNTDAEGNDLA